MMRPCPRHVFVPTNLSESGSSSLFRDLCDHSELCDLCALCVKSTLHFQPALLTEHGTQSA